MAALSGMATPEMMLKGSTLAVWGDGMLEGV